MEAMFCGLPIICSNYGGQVDFLKHGENALMIPVGDTEACADSILKLYKDKRLYTRCAANNVKRVRDFYAEAIADQYITGFLEVMPDAGAELGK